MARICRALHVILGEDKAFMGLFLPTLAATLKRLQELKDGGSIKTQLPLVDVLIDFLHRRFETYFEDMDCIIAAAIHPNFKLAYLDCSVLLKASRIPLVVMQLENWHVYCRMEWKVGKKCKSYILKV